ncbi:MAG TPA: outer membrane lipid asymmetry maintenance protein MlaD [Pseudomonadales bacterium]|nr:outer membrane lipid asymmetry maintenance protein MlaD [Pseudomonadales bacterium]
MNRTTIDLWVGVFVALGLAALVFLSLQVANLTGSTSGATYTLTARFDDLGGLKIKAPVKSAGVVVGRVTNVRFDNQTFEAVVTMNVEKRYLFPSDTSAKILTSGLLGDQYVGLLPGGDTEDLKDGDKIELTQGALVLENLISKFLFSVTSGGGKDGKDEKQDKKPADEFKE